MVAHSTGKMFLKLHYFNVRLALWELSSVIFKLGFNRAYDETVSGDTACALNIAVYLLCFFVEIKTVCSSSSGCNVQFHLFNKCGVGPGILTSNSDCFSGGQKLISK